MEGNNNQETKELTLEDLAAIMTTGFKESREHTKKLIDEKIEWLARNTQDNFLSMEEKFGKLETDVKGLKNDIKNVKSDTEDIKAEINKKVDKFEHNELVYRVEKVEEKLKLKQRLKFA